MNYLYSAIPIFFLCLGIAIPDPAVSLPIGYGYNQGSLEFDEIKTEDFIVYFDRRVPRDAKVAANSLIAAKPHLERWFDIKRQKPLIINMSAESENASFANFVTDSIELQTLGQGSRDLAWHEFTHTMMYEHLSNIFGPAGAIIHLPWMEAWFIEGLAEAISVSVGSEQQAGVERYQALNKDWPTWDRIHSLYTSGPFSYRGYATSGAFVAWILKTYNAKKLPESLNSFRDNTMPWMWPWAFTPFNNFWPMDTMLKRWTSSSGKELYSQYIKAAEDHWSRKAVAPLLTTKANTSFRVSSPQEVTSVSGVLYSLKEDDGRYYISDISSNKDGRLTGWGTVAHRLASDGDVYGRSFAKDQAGQVYISDHWPQANTQRAMIVLKDSKKETRIKRTASWIANIFLSEDKVWWIEQELEATRLCYQARRHNTDEPPKCLLETKTPQSLVFLGENNTSSGTNTEIFVRVSSQSALGDSHKILRIDPSTLKVSSFTWEQGGRPHSVAYTRDAFWILLANRSQRFLRKFSQEGQCLASIALSDLPLRILNSQTNRPWLINWMGASYAAALPNDNIYQETPCTPLDDHVSPLLIALNSKQDLTLAESLERSSIWSSSHEVLTSQQTGHPDLTTSAGAVTSDAKELTPSPSQWRGRPVFVFPWIGADDALGPQLGIVSVPLMDHMQNETVRATALLGLYSRFPYQELSLIENRWTPTWTFSVFRSQTYNGRYRDRETNEIYSSYLDEKGGRVEGFFTQRWKDFSLQWIWGGKSGHLAPYIGRARRYGNLNEGFFSARFLARVFPKVTFTLASQSRIAPDPLNEIFAYDVVGGNTGLTFQVGDGSIETEVEYERTRGKSRRDLQEMYLPLKTFLPGSGGGYNKNSFALTEDQGLFSPVFGETQGRIKLNLTHPIIENFDKFVGLIYIDRLDFSGFLNHGSAWYGQQVPDFSDMLTAQGYNVDLLMDNKGVRFNLGVGVGQVIKNPWQVYSTAGFDALF
jgi:hypothetical protein